MEIAFILIIDDDPNLRKTLADILKVKGYATLTAKDGAEGLACMRENPVNLALIDIGLPDISGLDVLSGIKTDHPSTAVIIFTGNATIESAIEATNRGAFSYLVKPYEIEQLLLQIRRAIEKQQAEQEQEELQVRLLQAQKLESVGQLAAGIAHEINTPAQFISANIDFLNQAFEESAQLIVTLLDLSASIKKGTVTEAEIKKNATLVEHFDWD